MSRIVLGKSDGRDVAIDVTVRISFESLEQLSDDRRQAVLEGIGRVIAADVEAKS